MVACMESAATSASVSILSSITDPLHHNSALLCTANFVMIDEPENQMY